VSKDLELGTEEKAVGTCTKWRILAWTKSVFYLCMHGEGANRLGIKMNGQKINVERSTADCINGIVVKKETE